MNSRRGVSVRSAISTTSSFAERMEALRKLRKADLETLQLPEIGRGSFGTVYEIPGTEWCLKKALTSPQTMFPEFINGMRISAKVNNKAWGIILQSGEFPNILMPRVPEYLGTHGMEDHESTTRWFEENGHRFPVENGGQKSGSVMCLERIMPLQQVIRESLIQLYFKPEKQAEALADEKNKACLCRVYLGSTSEEIEPEKRERECMTLQNFPLYLDQLEELNMDPFLIARDMALDLAAGHWAAGFDMLDVEYVIGSRPRVQARPSPSSISLKADEKDVAEKSFQRMRNVGANDNDHQTSFRNRAFQVWMIDFNKVSRINTTVGKNYGRNIQKLVCNTRATDGPYYPRAIARNENEWNLWLEFARTYIRASKTILLDIIESAEELGAKITANSRERLLKRPSLFINGWVEAEAVERNTTGKEFRKKLKESKWELP
ncbi:uncharacterized protein F5Z01DRAFT_649115 [Emericellopsis atlantica]|uniref:DUF3669 domain-containing protein n=1 Tax=Emericellopsis atlantica TaxID=2614577 RepID=A0A9P7ZS24_9HYPO|nr:uncharacterized protein F5Z01DRAFT_649115 [Emericellopsis atlantica]KAG9256807.1 hypothetical protein F5Z01DRAFT_649115 [Emericellopsis atlantica]